MTTPSALVRPSDVPFPRRLAARLALAVAFPLSLLPPHRLRAVLAVLRRGAVPASYERAGAARRAVCAVSLYCAGPRGCLPRSLGTALLCRFGGCWPTWCTGVRKVPPFSAHAWVEAEGRPVDEGVPDDYFGRLLTVAPGPSPRKRPLP
ncbi:lasso peptide biosynthesis B2 protein [Streptomyces mobaraensis]|uniref:Lasso peptide biosynthesis B2 protein n=1 Tax=Streptomyces mobaraensis TaxID=35621 RepID=A0A5N5W5D3_STRMB|nr:lasso peptide biosynthesis B2 protein [Streptomyces mobaraensis]KAB7842811.1 lasso peptide biosynthesis B2 protein [Streptomyces mobaraensis]